MRVTTNMVPDDLVRQLNTLGLRQAQLQNQASTGRRLQFPEDDPSAVRRVLDMQAESRTLAQYKTNIARLREQATGAYDAMGAVKKISDRISEIATLADGTKSPAELAIYGREVTELIQQAAQVLNGKSQGDYLFAGTRTDTRPFVVTTNPTGQVTGVAYQGNSADTQVEIAEGETLSVQVVGANSTGLGPAGLVTDSRNGADLFAHMISLQNNLLAGNTAAIATTDLPALQRDEQNIITQMATTGAISARLVVADNITATRSASLDKLISTAADADLAETLVRLTQTQTAYQATLQAGSKILSLSLLDYLH